MFGYTDGKSEWRMSGRKQEGEGLRHGHAQEVRSKNSGLVSFCNPTPHTPSSCPHTTPTLAAPACLLVLEQRLVDGVLLLAEVGRKHGLAKQVVGYKRGSMEGHVGGT